MCESVNRCTYYYNTMDNWHVDRRKYSSLNLLSTNVFAAHKLHQKVSFRIRQDARLSFWPRDQQVVNLWRS